MSNLSTPKKIAVILVIVIVMMVPVLLAFNDQGVQDALSSLGPQNRASGPDDSVIGNARYNEAADTADAADSADAVTGQGRASYREPKPHEAPAHTPKPGGANIIDPIKIVPTPTPIKTPAPKWVPEYPATDGELLASGLVEEDSVNVLIMGVDPTANLFDTLGVASVSRDAQTVRLVMFSRDLFIGYSDEVLANIKKIKHDKMPGEYKINNTYNVARNTEKYNEGIVYNDNRFENNAYDFLAQVVYEKFDILVDDYVRINTYGLVRLVDTFGGVRINVPVTMRYSDPTQNLNIHIQKGTQVLNGSQAEGFVRFRQGYDGNGNLSVNVDRTSNQIAFMKAFYEQHAKLSNIGKIPDVISNLRRNIHHSFSADDIFTVYVDILTAVVNDSYEFESVEFKYGTRRVNGAIHHIISEVVLPGQEAGGAGE